MRKDSKQAWDALPKERKSEWFNDQLDRYKEAATRTIKLPQFDKPIVVPSTKGMCKNGHVADEWGRCLDKECKYGR